MVANALEAFWFKDKETAIALSVDASISYLAVAGIYWTMPMLYEFTGDISYNFGISVLLTGVSLMAVLILMRLDKLAKDEPEEINEEEEDPTKETGCLASVKSLGMGYLLIVLSYAARILGYNLFEFVSSEYFQVRFGFTSVEAGFIISMPYLCFFIFTAGFGYVVYRIGRKPIISIVASSCVNRRNIAHDNDTSNVLYDVDGQQ